MERGPERQPIRGGEAPGLGKIEELGVLSSREVAVALIVLLFQDPEPTAIRVFI